MNHGQKIQRARQSTSRKKGKPKRTRGAEKPKPIEEDPNASILIPKTKEQKEAERKDKIRRELTSQSNSKWSSKKKKRLEKYIDRKLRKEERVLIFEKLVHTQAEIPSSLHLQASASLGTGRASTHLERLERLEDKEVRQALDGRTGKRKRRNHFYPVAHSEGEESNEDSDLLKDDVLAPDPMGAERKQKKSAGADLAPVSISQSVVSLSSATGSALRRNPDGTTIAPKVQGKKGKNVALKSWRDKRRKTIHNVKSPSDSSFDSSDSAYDSSGDEEDSGGSNHLNSESSTHELEKSVEDRPPRNQLGFKDWAIQQLNAAKGYGSPTISDASVAGLPPPPNKREKLGDPSHGTPMRGPLGEDLKLPDTSFAHRLGPSDEASIPKSRVIVVKRPPDVEEARVFLPIVTEEQPIMEAIMLHPVVIICGETGSGKTTQVPQFLYECGFGTPGHGDNPGMIGITQPRRVAAMSMATRVAHELSLTTSRVSYQIRYDATVSPSTSIKFMTDGVLLRELATDFLLTRYSVIIIDEAHERSINTDILIGVLSRVLRLRESMWKEGKEGAKPLRLIVMSATLRVSDFADNRLLFSSPPPVINVPARQHPVTIHFSRRTSPDYVTEAIKKTIKIHTRLPPGGILIFLTGQNEIIGVCRKLEGKYGAKALKEKKKQRGPTAPADRAHDDSETQYIVSTQVDVEAEDIDLGDGRPDDLAFDVDQDMDDDDPDALDSDNERGLDEELGLESEGANVPMHVVPLYSLLPSEKQLRVFEPPPPGSRLVVVATNVAETSLTIPGIRYVVDCGRAKERRHDFKNGIQAFVVNWISKASASQRAGRAGRTGPGHCYRLYSSALFEHHFEQFSLPEIQRIPIEGVVLQMKSMHIDSVINFPFPTPPERPILYQAEKVLTHLGALSSPQVKAGSDLGEGQITALGRTMALFPLSPRFSRMLINGQQHGCLPYVISIVAALSVGDPFLHEEGLIDEKEKSDPNGKLTHLTNDAAKAREEQRLRRKAFFASQRIHASLGQFSSDILKILSVVGAYEYAGGGHKFCAEHFVRPKAMEEIHKLRAQISDIVKANFSGVDVGFVSNLPPPGDLQLKVLRQLLAAGFIDQVAVRKDRIANTSSGEQYETSKGVPYRALGIEDDVFIHPSSILANVSPPEYVVFNEVVRTTRVWLKGLTVVNPAWISILGKSSLCSFSKPAKNMAGVMMTIPRFGPDGWELPAIKAETLEK